MKILLEAVGVKCQEMLILERSKIKAFPSNNQFINNASSQARSEIMELVVLMELYQKVHLVIQLDFSSGLLHLIIMCEFSLRSTISIIDLFIKLRH